MTAAALPDPLVPPDVDLRDFQYMELDVQALRDSRFAAEVEPEAFRAGVLLWCAAWHQVPAGSLPDNDTELSNLAGFGRVIKEWRKVREQALSLFIACDDGRLYHPFIAEKALAAWDAKRRHQYEKLCERTRKENKRRGDSGQPTLSVPTFDEWKAGVIPAEDAERSSGNPPERKKRSAGNPPENPLRGNGTERNGTETLYSEPNGSGATAPPPAPPGPPEPPPGTPPTDRDMVFANGVTLLTASGVTDRNARSFLAAQCKAHGEAAVRNALDRCAAERPIEPVPWLVETLKTAAKPPTAKVDRIAAHNAEVARRFESHRSTP